MNRLWHFLVRIAAFPSKEFFEIMRQPRLVLLLILGPFAILALFGFGFSNDFPPLQALFVVPEDSTLREQIISYTSGSDTRLVFAGLTPDILEARRQLRENEVDIVVVTPDNLNEAIRGGQQVVFTVYHNAIDPTQVNYIQAFTQLYVDEINRNILRDATRQGQERSAAASEELAAARQEVHALRTAVEVGDEQGVQQHSDSLEEHVSELGIAMGAMASFLGNVEGATTDGQSGDQSGTELEDRLAAIRGNTEDIRASGIEDRERTIQELEDTERELAELESTLNQFERVNPYVIVSPIRSEVETIAPVDADITTYYAPGVIGLLLQHLCVTLAGLSIVIERELGTMELFKVSPLTAMEILIGKYLSYLFLVGLLAFGFVAIVVFLLGVPMLGLWTDYGLVVLALILASLGYGFLVSLASDSVSQAVQYSMIILLLSVFFSGFFQSLDLLRPEVRVVSLAMPATYAIRMLETVMLRGEFPEFQLLNALFGMAGVLFVGAWFWLRGTMRQQ